MESEDKMSDKEPICDPVDCRNCAKLRRETESWEMPHIFWFECSAKPHVANLKSFPFRATRCEEFQQREKPVQSSQLLSELTDLQD